MILSTHLLDQMSCSHYLHLMDQTVIQTPLYSLILHLHLTSNKLRTTSFPWQFHQTNKPFFPIGLSKLKLQLNVQQSAAQKNDIQPSWKCNLLISVNKLTNFGCTTIFYSCNGGIFLHVPGDVIYYIA